jgi:hypothetical protein
MAGRLSSWINIADMLYRLLADAVLSLHLFFILFVVFGGLLALRWRRAMYLHLPAAIWGALIEFMGWTCPLTPWENRLRRLAGDEGYAGGFIEHYLLPLVYPDGLTREIQIILGVAVLVANVAIYAAIIWRHRRRRPATHRSEKSNR